MPALARIGAGTGIPIVARGAIEPGLAAALPDADRTRNLPARILGSRALICVATAIDWNAIRRSVALTALFCPGKATVVPADGGKCGRTTLLRTSGIDIAGTLTAADIGATEPATVATVAGDFAIAVGGAAELLLEGVVNIAAAVATVVVGATLLAICATQRGIRSADQLIGAADFFPDARMPGWTTFQIATLCRGGAAFETTARAGTRIERGGGRCFGGCGCGRWGWRRRNGGPGADGPRIGPVGERGGGRRGSPQPEELRQHSAPRAS